MDPFTIQLPEVQSGYSRPEEDDYWELQPVERMKESLDQTIGTLFGAGSMVADALGFEKASGWAAEKAGTWFEKAADRDLAHTKFTEIDGVTDAAKWVSELVVSYLPDLALMALGGVGAATGATRAAGTKVGTNVVKNMVESGFKQNVSKLSKEAAQNGIKLNKDQLYKQAAKDSVKQTAALLGASSVEGLQASGQFYLDDKENRGADANPFRAMGVGLGTTAIGMFSPITRGVAGGVSGRLPAKFNLGRITLGEFAEESGQEAWAMLNEAGIDPEVTFAEMVSTPEGQARLWESGVAGAVLGFTFGGGAKTLLEKKEKKIQSENGGLGPDEEVNSVLNSVGIDTTKDQVLDRDIPKIRDERLLARPSWMQSPQRAEQNYREYDLDSIKVTQTVLVEETGEVQEMEVPARVAIEEADNNIEKWYTIRECLAS